MMRNRSLALLLAVLMLASLSLTGCAGSAPGPSAEVPPETAQPNASAESALVVKDGMLQPILRYSDPRAADYSNENSDILRYCVYVETDHDTDSDGMADLVKVMVQVPRAAAEGRYKAATRPP